MPALETLRKVANLWDLKSPGLRARYRYLQAYRMTQQSKFICVAKKSKYFSVVRNSGGSRHEVFWQTGLVNVVQESFDREYKDLDPQVECVSVLL